MLSYKFKEKMKIFIVHDVASQLLETSDVTHICMRFSTLCYSFNMIIISRYNKDRGKSNAHCPGECRCDVKYFIACKCHRTTLNDTLVCVRQFSLSQSYDCLIFNQQIRCRGITDNQASRKKPQYFLFNTFFFYVQLQHYQSRIQILERMQWISFQNTLNI